MKRTLPDPLLRSLNDFISARTALHFSKDQWDVLEHKAAAAAGDFGFTAPEAFIRWLVSSRITSAQLDTLVSHLTVHETYFWREPRVFEALCTRILPEAARTAARKGRGLRIWSAGCATGEEPYSLAIALLRALPEADVRGATILATDINPRVLKKAAAGIYRKWSFRNTPSWLKDGFFTCRGNGTYELAPRIRKMVTFSYLNLAEDAYPSPLNGTNAMDIIFCRNVTMYFTPGQTRAVGKKFFASLVRGGWLAVGASELSQYTFSPLATVSFPDAIVYRKSTATAPPPLPQAADTAYGDPVREPRPAALPEYVPPEPPPVRADGYGDTPAAAEPAVPPPMRKPHAEAAGETEKTIRALANRGDLNEALALCRKKLTADKLDAGVQYLYGIVLQELGREEEAVTAFKRTLYLEPTHLLGHYSLGNLMLHRGNAAAAKKCFENTLTLLRSCGNDDVLPAAGGLTAGRFKDIVRAAAVTGAVA